MKWRKAEVKISTTDGEPVVGAAVKWCRVNGYTARGCPLAVTEAHGSWLKKEFCWRVTHKLSGSAIAAARTAEDAQRIAESVLAAGDWNRPGVELMSDRKFLLAARKALSKATGTRVRKVRPTTLVIDRSGELLTAVRHPLARRSA